MPCRYYDPGEEERILLSQYRTKIDTLTRLLCEAMQLIEARLHAADVPPELVAWWERHKELDRARLAEETKKKVTEEEKAAALAKLTPHERKLLGLPC